MAEKNSTILKSAWLVGTNDYQQRIPATTQGNITATVDALFDPMNKQYLNQFIDCLVNRIGMTYVRSKKWDNVLAPFKGAKMNYGATIQEVAPKWIKAHSYNDSDETLLRLHRPEAQAWYHSQNRKDQYAITINYEELRTAFTEEYGLNNLISEILTVPMSSDNYDEYNIMVQLIAEYEKKWGFFKQHLTALPTDETTGKEFLKHIKTYAGKLQFPSCLYNASDIEDIPVFTKPEELILLTTPEVSASVDVETLASVFHLDKADTTNVTKIIINEFPIPNACALLTTRDFFVCNDTVYQTTSFYNPQRMDTTYYLQHWGIYSVSPFVPAILFTTDAGSAVNTITEEVLEIGNLYAADMRGSTIELNPTATDFEVALKTLISITIDGKPPSTPAYSQPRSSTWSIQNATDPKTYIEYAPVTIYDGSLSETYDYKMHIGKKDYSKDLLVTATLTYINPSGTTNSISKSKTINYTPSETPIKLATTAEDESENKTTKAKTTTKKVTK